MVGQMLKPLLTDNLWVLSDGPTVWLDGFIIFQSLDVCIIENLPGSIRVPKQVQKFAKYQTNTIPKFSQRLLKFCQSGEISLNMVTLVLTTLKGPPLKLTKAATPTYCWVDTKIGKMVIVLNGAADRWVQTCLGLWNHYRWHRTIGMT